MPYDLGDTVPLSVEVRDGDDALTNATSVTLTITLPDGTTTSPSVTNPPTVTGTYTYDYVTTQAGRHTVRWVSTGPSAAYSDAFDVREATPQYIVSLKDAKDHLNITTTDRSRDEELRRFVEGATIVVEDKIGPVVVRSFTERHNSGSYLLLKRTPVVSLTAVVPWLTTGSTYAVGDLKVDADTGIVERLNGGSFTGGPFSVTYKAGRTVVPATATIAALDLIRINFRSQKGGPVSRYGGEEGEFRQDLGMFVPHSVLSNLAPLQDAGIA